MVFKWVKRGLLAGVAAAAAGALIFGGDLASYLKSSGRGVQRAIRQNIPTEFELQRARDLVEEIIPEMHANIRMIAQEEIEIEQLKGDIAQSEKSLASEKERLQKLSTVLTRQQASYTLSGREFTHEQIKEDVGRRFECFKEGELVLQSKQRLLTNREKSLAGARQMLEQTRAQKALLEEKIKALDGQHRLLQAAAAGSQLQVDSSKLAQTAKLINDIKKRLDVAERVLSHEARFAEAGPMETVSDEDLLAQINEYFARPGGGQGELKVAAEGSSAAAQ